MLTASPCQRSIGFAQTSFIGVRLPNPFSVARVQQTSRLHICAGLIGPGKKWEHYPLNQNKKVVRLPIHVKKGDTVQVIAGKDKGKVGEIQQVLVKTGMIVVKGVNIKYKTRQPRQEGEKGSIEQTETPIHHSNAMLYSTEKQVRSRVGHKFLEDGKKVRYLRKTGEVIDK